MVAVPCGDDDRVVLAAVQRVSRECCQCCLATTLQRPHLLTRSRCQHQAHADGRVELAVLKADGASSDTWVEAADAPFLTRHAAEPGLRRVPDAQWSQRAIQDRVANPHGEHAENVWVLPELQLASLGVRRADRGGRAP